MELLKAASQTKEVPFKVAYGLTLTGMRQWGLYISEPRCALEPPFTPTSPFSYPHSRSHVHQSG